MRENHNFVVSDILTRPVFLGHMTLPYALIIEGSLFQMSGENL